MGETGKPEPNNYECDKCKCLGTGGYNPTMFIFDQIKNEYDITLCASCYKNFWDMHEVFCRDFLSKGADEND